jgi:hypothetical protein
MADILNNHGITISADPTDPLADRLKKKLAAELAEFEREEAYKADLRTEYGFFARQLRDQERNKISAQNHSRTVSVPAEHLTDSHVSEAASVVSNMTRTELADLFEGRNSKGATELGRQNMLAYLSARRRYHDGK